MGPNSRSRRVSSLALVILVLSLAGPASSGETDRFRFEPSGAGGTRRSFRLGIAPGQTASDSVVAVNKTNADLRLRVYAADAVRQSDGAIAVAPFGSRPTGMAVWITISKPEIAIAARATEAISFSVGRPKDGNDRLGAIVAEEILGERQSEGVEVVTRVALLVHIADPSEDDAVHIESVQMVPHRTIVPSRASVVALIRNPTSEPAPATVDARVKTLTGRRFDLGKKVIQLTPGKTSTLDFEWDSVSRFGALARAEVTMTINGSSSSARSPLEPIVAFWMMLVILSGELYLGVHKLIATRGRDLH